MINLILNEIIKIFHKKSIFIIWGIIAIFCLLNNILYKTDYDNEGNYKYENKENLTKEIEKIKEEIEKYDNKKSNELSIFISLKTKLDLYHLKEEFLYGTWQYNKIEEYLYELLYQRNIYLYQEQDNPLLSEINIQIDKKYNNLKNNNWKYFLEEQIRQLELEILQIKENISMTKTQLKKIEYLNQKRTKEDQLNFLKYRIKEEILEDNSYLNKALVAYQESKDSIRYYQSLGRKKTKEEIYQYQKVLSSNKINQYILKNKKNINQQNNLNYQLRTIVEDYELFIVILILMVTSIIICDEFHTGTIKLLLIKPHSRCKILLSKYFASLFVILLSIIFLIMIQLIIGTIIFGTESLKLPVLSYNYQTDTLISHSVFMYMIIRIIAKLPFIIMISLISMTIGVITTNTVVSIVIPLILYLFTPMFEKIIIKHQLMFAKILIPMNWNFQDYLFGGVSSFPYTEFRFSCIVWIVHFIIFIILAFILFQKKDIKNI